MKSGPVWIDVANSPHVLFFEPVIRELRARGVDVICTARDFAQTISLCRGLGVKAIPVGVHGGANVWNKAGAWSRRAYDLRRLVRASRPSLAVSHNSYSQMPVARSIGVPVVTAMDYEYQPANHLAFRCADLVVVPDAFPLDRLRNQGARASRTWRYPGLKEHVSMAGFRPDPEYLAAFGLDTVRPVVVVRPPADMALYHRFENPLLKALLDRLLREDASVVVLPRTELQVSQLEERGFGGLLWRGEALDGRQLIAGADLVVSAGGTMNREAAVLGTPAYSFYAGRIAAVDRVLIAQGRLRLLRSLSDVERLVIQRKTAVTVREIGNDLVREFVDRCLAIRRQQ